MDFFESWFGISPDGGDGTTELTYVVAFIGIVTAVMLFRKILKT